MRHMRNTNRRIMFDCFTSSHSVYFEAEYDDEFRKQYKGVIVNARGYDGHGHFAIRKPEMEPNYKWIMWKNDREKLHHLYFSDRELSIRIDAEMVNPSSRELTFDQATYEDLKACIPSFLKYVKYKFTTETTDDGLTLTFEPVTLESRYKRRHK